MDQRDRTERSLSRRDLFVRSGVVATSGALVAATTAFGGDGEEQVYVAAKLVEPLSRDAAIVELLDVGERVYVQAAPGAAISNDGETLADGLLGFSRGQELLLGAAQPPVAGDPAELAATAGVDPIFNLRYWLESQFMTTIVVGGTIDLNHEFDEVDGLLDRALSQ